MAAVRWGLVAMMALAAGGTWLYWARTGTHEHGAPAATQYRCPMHPAVIQDRPGSCPICGMDLVQASAARPGATEAAPSADASATAYTCPMHPEVTSADPKARCPKCGMFLVAAATKPAGLTSRHDHLRARAADRRPHGSGVEATCRPAAPDGRVHLRQRRRARPRHGAHEWMDRGAPRGAERPARLEGSAAGDRLQHGAPLGPDHLPEHAPIQRARGGRGWPRPGQRRPPPPRALRDGEAGHRRGRQDRTADDAVPIRSPVEGYVARKNALAGLYVQPGHGALRDRRSLARSGCSPTCTSTTCRA